jgi:hypothetical protein
MYVSSWAPVRLTLKMGADRWVLFGSAGSVRNLRGYTPTAGTLGSHLYRFARTSVRRKQTGSRQFNLFGPFGLVNPVRSLSSPLRNPNGKHSGSSPWARNNRVYQTNRFPCPWREPPCVLTDYLRRQSH